MEWVLCAEDHFPVPKGKRPGGAHGKKRCYDPDNEDCTHSSQVWWYQAGASSIQLVGPRKHKTGAKRASNCTTPHTPEELTWHSLANQGRAQQQHA